MFFVSSLIKIYTQFLLHKNVLHNFSFTVYTLLVVIPCVMLQLHLTKIKQT